ncbi:MAG TPA: MFS transporter [Solirubrobacteraceae bacterium]|nr:MFS transporter [Solirubrobacteraceae bacterium]
MRRRLGRVFAAVAVDVGLLRRRREYRLLVAGQAISDLGSMITLVAIPVQTYKLTGSSVAVGLLGVAEFVPILVLALVGGALADAFDRRRLVMIAETGALVIVGGLVANALLPEPQLWVLYVAAALIAACTAIRRPPLDALMPRLVERDELKSASALQWAVHNIAHMAGPAIGGVLIATAGAAVTYTADLVTFAVSLVALAAMRTPPPPERQALGLRAIGEGLRYAGSRQELIGTYVIDIIAMFFGMPMALFPALAERYGGGAVVGLLYAAPSAGAVVATLSSGWSRRVHHHGRAVVLAAASWGVAIVGFGLAGELWLALLCLAAAGGFDAVSGIFRATIWNETIPDRLRGRLAGVEMISWSSGPLLGNAEAGFASALVGLRTSVVAGGVMCVIGSFALAAALPKLWRYDSRVTA